MVKNFTILFFNMSNIEDLLKNLNKITSECLDSINKNKITSECLDSINKNKIRSECLDCLKNISKIANILLESLQFDLRCKIICHSQTGKEKYYSHDPHIFYENKLLNK